MLSRIRVRGKGRSVNAARAHAVDPIDMIDVVKAPPIHHAKRCPMEINDLVTVYTMGNPLKAQMVKNFLEAEGIKCFLDGINQAAEPGLIGLEIDVQVAAADADRARKLLKQNEAR